MCPPPPIFSIRLQPCPPHPLGTKMGPSGDRSFWLCHCPPWRPRSALALPGPPAPLRFVRGSRSLRSVGRRGAPVASHLPPGPHAAIAESLAFPRPAPAARGRCPRPPPRRPALPCPPSPPPPARTPRAARPARRRSHLRLPRRPGGGRCGRGLRHSGFPGCCSARRGVEGGPAEVGPAEGGNAGDAITKAAGLRAERSAPPRPVRPPARPPGAHGVARGGQRGAPRSWIPAAPQVSALGLVRLWPAQRRSTRWGPFRASPSPPRVLPVGGEGRFVV